MTEYCRFGAFSVHRRLKKEVDGFKIHENIIKRDNRDFLYLHDLTDCKDVANVLSVYHHNCEKLREENEQLKSENEELKKRDNLVLGYLTDDGIITFEKYNEIVDYLYKKWQKRNGDVE